MAAEDNSNTSTDNLTAPPEELDFSAIEQAASKALPISKEINITYFSKKTRKSTQLIGNKNENNVLKVRREWLSFDLLEPIYVTSIKIFAAGYEDYHEMEISFVDDLNKLKVEDSKKFDGETFSFEPKRFINGFGIRPSERFFKSSSITRISVHGVEQKYFSEVIGVFEDVSREREKIENSLKRYLDEAKKSFATSEANKAHIIAQIEEISIHNTKTSTLESKVEDLTNLREDIDKKIAIGASIEKERNERIDSINLNIDNLDADRRSINKDISEKQTYLRDLKENIHLFPTEIAGYVRQGTININLYTAICLVPIIIIGLVTYRLFSNSEGLLNFFVDNNKIGIIEFLISRIPYVIVSSSVLIVCYSIIYRLVSEIININRRRQDLYKISIIATDISFASQDGMELTDEQRYELRTQTKVEMLKEHLKQHMSEDYLYTPKKSYTARVLSLVSKSHRIPGGEEKADGTASA